MTQLLASTMLLLQAASAGAASMGDAPTVDAEPVARLGSVTGADGPTTVHVADVLARPDGSLWVADVGKPAVELWSAGGRLRRTLGREGEGPGEYRAPAAVGRTGDTLWVRDGPFRFVLFTPEGEPAELVRLPGTPVPGVGSGLPAGRFPLEGVALLADGSVLAAPDVALHPHTLGTRPRIAYHRIARTGEVGDALLEGIAADGGISIHDDPDRPHMRFITSNPFGGADLVGVRPDGSALVVVRPGPGNGAGGSGALSVTALGPSGEQRWRREVRLAPYADRGASVRRAVRAHVDEGMDVPDDVPMDRDEEALSRGYREALESAVERIPVSDLVVGSDGSVLLERTLPLPDGRRLWLLFTEEGRPAARVRVPAGVEVMDVRDGTIWGTTRGELDVQHVTKLALPPGPGRQ